MLVLILGPSGVGKSAAIQQLVEKYSWIPLVSVVTRPERGDELYKVNISTRSYEMLSSNKKLWSDIEQNGFKYGLLTAEVSAALSDKDHFHVVDYGLSSRAEYFEDVEHLCIYLSVDDEGVLSRRIIAAGRPERVAQALAVKAQLDQWYATSGNQPSVRRVANQDGKLDLATERIVEMAQAWCSGRPRC